MLYLNLKKAAPPAVSTDSKSAKQTARSYEESFNRVAPGVHGEPTESSPSGSWDTLSELDQEIEEKRKNDKKLSQELGIIKEDPPKKKGDDDKENLTKSLISLVHYYSENIVNDAPNPAEVEFLTTQCFKSIQVEDERGVLKSVNVPYTVEDVRAGRAMITGRRRSEFNSWLQDRLRKSISKLT